MAANEVSLAETITQLLNQQTNWTVKFTAERVYVPDWDLRDELKDLQVVVFPDSAVATGRERAALNKVYRCGIAACQRLQRKCLNEIDALMQTTQEISDLFERQAVLADDGKKFSNTGWEDRIRFDPNVLTREIDDRRQSVHSGTFLSVRSFAFLMLD